MITKFSQSFSTRAIAMAAVLVLAHATSGAENVRAQLSREQQQNGLSIQWYYAGINTVEFKSRFVTTDKAALQTYDVEHASISPDGSLLVFPAASSGTSGKGPLTIVRRNGDRVSQYPGLGDSTPQCWSHDGLKLVVASKTSDFNTPEYHLFVLDLASKATQEFGDAGSYVTSQCWSQDDKQIVFARKDAVGIYDLADANSRTLAPGNFPSWSPDGLKIAFQGKDGYYVIAPAGGEPKRLFKAKGRSQIFWSPDSRIVAYFVDGGTFKETLKYLDVGLIQLRVKRLSDGSEDWIWQTPDVPPAWSLQCVWLNVGNINTRPATLAHKP